MSKKHTDDQWARLLRQAGGLRLYVDKKIFPYLKPYLPTEDVVHRTLAYAYENPEQWNHIPDEELPFYLKKMARFVILNDARVFQKKHVLTSLDQSSPRSSEGMEPRTDAQAVRQIHKKEKQHALHRIIDRMASETDRKALTLAWLEGCSTHQIAEKLNRPVREIYYRLQKGLETCRKIARRDSFAGFRISGETR